VKRTFVSLAVVGLLGVGLLPLSAQAAVAGPVNLAPDDSGTRLKNVVLTWDAVGGATAYEVEVTNDGFGTDGEVLSDTAASNRFVMPVDLPRGDYRWRVRATLPSGTSDWSDEADLVRGWAITEEPVVSKVSGDPEDWAISWAPVPDASFYEVQYSPEGIEPDNMAPPEYAKNDIVTCFTTHTTFTPFFQSKGTQRAIAEGDLSDGDCSGNLDGTYKVRVRARDGSVDTRETPFSAPANTCTGVWQTSVGDGFTGNVPECSGWSDDVSGFGFNARSDEPSEPTGLVTSDATGPCDVADPCTDTPVMSWNDADDADFYRVYLGRDRDTIDYDRVYDVYGNSFQMGDTMPDRELPWYWRVQACVFTPSTPDDTCGPASNSGGDAASFGVKNKALKLSGAAPTSGDPTVKEQHVDFTVPNEVVQADHQAKAFRIQVSTKSDFSATVHTATFDQQAGDSTHTTYRWDDVSDGTYYWRYRAVDQTGLLSPWSQDGSLSFTVNASIPKVSIKSDSGWGLTDSITLESDKALSGVTSNTLGVTLKDGARLTGKITELSSTSWKFTPDTRWIAGAAYVPYVGASVTASNGKVAVGDDVVGRPSGLVDSKTASMKKVNGDFSWKTLSASDAIGQSYVAAKHQASSNKVPLVSVKFGGSKVALYACKSSANGIADVYIDGAKVKSIDLYRASSKCGEVWSKTGLTDTVHTIEVKVSGKKSAESSGTFVGVDAVKAG
jgi:hypothetical protein